MKLIAIVGYHNTGKTTLAEELIRRLRDKGYKVGYVKHDPKGHGVTDRKGSDTDRIFGLSERVVLSSPGRLTLWSVYDDNPFAIAEEFFGGFDIVILEGYKSLEDVPKVAVGDVRAKNVLLKVEGVKDAGHIIELLESMEDNV